MVEVREKEGKRERWGEGGGGNSEVKGAVVRGSSVRKGDMWGGGGGRDQTTKPTKNHSGTPFFS